MRGERIYLSPPNLSGNELSEVEKVFTSRWIAPVGPAIDAFETALGENYTDKYVLALNSGTSALHLALILAGVGDGDEVLVGSFTFAACANAVLYERAIPVFMDSDRTSWNLDPDILEEHLSQASILPKALIVTHLYGMPADIERITAIAKSYGVRVIEDAAESLGAKVNGQHVGSFGDFGVISFNGNKVITTGGGGALICKEKDWERGRHLATQANSGRFGYDHKEAGFNYRMSNVLAGVGLGQLPKLEEFIEKKRSIFQIYQDNLSEDFIFLEEPGNRFSNRWLTTMVARDDSRSIDELIRHLETQNIETRKLWKPLHLHDAYSSSVFVGGGACETLYEKGICLPSGSGLTNSEQDLVIQEIKHWLNQ